jgi:hypothetical protein
MITQETLSMFLTQSFIVKPKEKPNNPGILHNIACTLSVCVSNHVLSACSLILSVTGGAESFEVPPGLLTAIRSGLVGAARSKDAWIISGGTNTGVMKLVGECMKAAQLDRPIPLIGIGL